MAPAVMSKKRNDFDLPTCEPAKACLPLDCSKKNVSHGTTLRHGPSHRQEESRFSPVAITRPPLTKDPRQQACGKAVQNIVIGVELPFVHHC